MAFPPVFELFEHEAMPSWRSRKFWFDTRLSIAMPCLIVGMIVALYLVLAIKIFATALFYFVDIDAIRTAAMALENNVSAPWKNAFEAFLFIVCIFVGENIARAALDISALKAFSKANERRFMRAAIGAAVLTAGVLAERVLGNFLGVEAVSGAGGLVVFSTLAAAIFASLSLAFRQGSILKEEQDLTV